MTDDEALHKAVKIAGEAFKDKTDKAGQPYIIHCLTVMEGVKQHGKKVMTAAVLHDLLEDCGEWTAERLLDEGFSKKTVELVKTLTRSGGISYQDYIEKIALEPETIAVKCSDLRHNMDLTRLPSITEKDIDRIKKYHKAYQYLVNKI